MPKKIKNEWWTCPTEAENGRLIMVSGRDGVGPVRDTGKYTARVTVVWNYDPTPEGMPDTETSKLMGDVTDALLDAFNRDPIGVMTGIYTGDGKREWVFYTRNLNIFGRVFNRALEALETIPIVIEAENDPDWAEYDEMRNLTYIPPED